MYDTVKILLSKGMSQRGIARELNISRKAEGKIIEQLDQGYKG